MVVARRAGLCRPWKFEKSPISTGLCGDCAESHLSRVNAFFSEGNKKPAVTRAGGGYQRNHCGLTPNRSESALMWEIVSERCPERIWLTRDLEPISSFRSE